MGPRLPHPACLLREDEVEVTAIRAQGTGGQNVNKVSSAIHLRFDVRASSLPEEVKERLLRVPDQRITREGVVVIKSQGSRSQDMNRQDALLRLQALIDSIAVPPRERRPTQPSRGARQRRLESKSQRSQVKAGGARSWPDGRGPRAMDPRPAPSFNTAGFCAPVRRRDVLAPFTIAHGQRQINLHLR